LAERQRNDSAWKYNTNSSFNKSTTSSHFPNPSTYRRNGVAGQLDFTSAAGQGGKKSSSFQQRPSSSNIYTNANINANTNKRPVSSSTYTNTNTNTNTSAYTNANRASNSLQLRSNRDDKEKGRGKEKSKKDERPSLRNILDSDEEWR
jgi:hypothetical protein